MEKILNFFGISFLFTFIFIISGCANNPASSRDLVSKTCKEFLSDATYLYNDTIFSSPSAVRALKLSVKDFKQASDAEPTNKNLRQVYVALEENYQALILKQHSDNWSKIEADIEREETFDRNLITARLFCINLEKAKLKE